MDVSSFVYNNILRILLFSGMSHFLVLLDKNLWSHWRACMIRSQRKTGCCWEKYKVYKYLKGLDYIIRRHRVPWTSKNAAIRITKWWRRVSLYRWMSWRHDDVTILLRDLQICDARAVFVCIFQDVFSRYRDLWRLWGKRLFGLF